MKSNTTQAQLELNELAASYQGMHYDQTLQDARNAVQNGADLNHINPANGKSAAFLLLTYTYKDKPGNLPYPGPQAYVQGIFELGGDPRIQMADGKSVFDVVGNAGNGYFKNQWQEYTGSDPAFAELWKLTFNMKWSMKDLNRKGKGIIQLQKEEDQLIAQDFIKAIKENILPPLLTEKKRLEAEYLPDASEAIKSLHRADVRIAALDNMIKEINLTIAKPGINKKDCQTEILKTINTHLTDSSLDKYAGWARTLARLLLNAVMLIFAPVKKLVTGTWCYSMNGQSHDIAENARDAVENPASMQPLQPRN